MKVHQYFYGPLKSGYDFKTSPELTKIIDEDIIQDLYCTKGNKTKRVEFSKVYTGLNGPVVGLTRIEPVQAPDGRRSTVNRSVFVNLTDLIDDLKQVLDKPPTFPLKTVKR